MIIIPLLTSDCAVVVVGNASVVLTTTGEKKPNKCLQYIVSG